MLKPDGSCPFRCPLPGRQQRRKAVAGKKLEAQRGRFTTREALRDRMREKFGEREVWRGMLKVSHRKPGNG